MPIDRFFIKPFSTTSGLRNDTKPFLIPDEAFARLDNAYVFRGRLRKRFGSRWLGNLQQTTRLRVNVGAYAIPLTGGAGVGITDGVGNATGTVPGGLYQLGQKFVIGAETDTVTSALAGAQPMTSTGPSVTHTFNIGTGAYNFAGAPINTQIFFFPNPATTAAITGNISGFAPGTIWQIGQMLSIGNTLFTVWQANGAMLTTGAATGTFNTATGAFVITGNNENPSTAVYFYPSLPVMGLVSFETTSINDEPLIAFDTQFAYQYVSPTGWERLALETTPGAATWHGSNSQFFWGESYNGANAFEYDLFVTNFNEAEPNFMRILPFATLTWDNFRPALTAANYIDSARIIVPFKNRLLMFNTWENEAGTQRHYPFRMRYSQVGSAVAADAWREDIPGKGSGLDCPTNESIITVEFVKDRLIVFLERSTWEISYSGNQIYPFEWQQINTELGAESTFSIIPFDKIAVGVGNVGIVACSGANVDRIDNSIPDEVFAIHNTDDGIERVYGIRDYFVEMLYWTFPDPLASANFPFPNRVLIYNYKTGTWSFNDDSITAFGYFQPSTGVTWSSTTVTWDDDVAWDSGSLQAKFRNVIAGNQTGWTFLVDPDVSTNCPALYINNITIAVAGSNVITVTSPQHNLRQGDYVYFQDIQNSAGNLTLINDTIFPVTVTDATPNTFTFVYEDDAGTIIAGTYTGGGLIARVSQIDILTKQYNFYAEDGRNAYVSKVDFLVDRTTFGEIEVDYFVSTNANSMVDDSRQLTGTGSLLGTSNLQTSPYTTVPFEAAADQLWHPIYLQADGEYIQLRLYLNDEQMRSTNVRESQFQLNHMIFYAQKTSSRLQ